MSISITRNQERQLTRLVGDAVLAIVTDKDTAQQLIENGGKLQDKVKEMTLDFINSQRRYADEEVFSSNYAYPLGYQVKSLEEQAEILHNLFPNLSTYHVEVDNQPLPEGAEGRFLIPRWDKVADNYNKAVEVVLGLIAKKRGFYNYRGGQLELLRQTERTVQFFEQIGKQENSDFLVIPAQFGMRHRGRSARRAREVFLPNEFGLGAFAVACMTLTHPKRFVTWAELDVDCAGDEYSFPGDDQLHSPIFCFGDFGLEFSSGAVNDASEGYGSASGFVSQ